MKSKKHPNKAELKKTELGSIPQDWNESRLGELGELKNGVNFGRNDFGKGFPIINVTNLFRGKYATTDNLDEIKEETLKTPENYFLKKGDLLFTRSSLKHSGTGQAAMVNQLPKEKTLFSGFIIRFRKNPNSNINEEYLNYLVRSKIYRDYMKQIMAETTITNINQPFLANLPIIIPSPKEQKFIAKLLSGLDNRGELNNQTNITLEDIGQALFKHWFVDFEFPNENGAPFKSNGGKLIDSELGKIPEKWNIAMIKDLVSLSKKTVLPMNSPETDFCHYSIPNYDINKRPIIQKGSEILSNKFIVQENSILVSKLNPDTPRVWAVKNPSTLSISSTEFLVFIAHKHYSFAYFTFISSQVKQLMKGLVTGTSKSHQRVNPKDILKLPIIMPPLEVLEKFEKITKDIIPFIERTTQENIVLERTRDSLLPKLMSGEIRIPIRVRR